MNRGQGRPSPLWRIIGIGSPAAGDDLGWLAIDWLRSAGLDRHAELLTLDRPGPALLDHLQPDARVVLIDAMEAGLPAGTLRELVLDDLLAHAHPPSSHHLGLAETLALAQALGALPGHLHLLGIQMAGGGEDLPSSEALAAEVVRRVRAMLPPGT
ncbi:MAG: hydrogenase maturation protease [Thioalkalivibrio sp.]|nr:MAG: hydrogenase maturation protease [Thioalkalivibrio sp.]